MRKQKKTETHRCVKNYFRYRHDKTPDVSRICLNAIAMMETLGTVLHKLESAISHEGVPAESCMP